MTTSSTDNANVPETFEDWIDAYHPVLNHIRKDAPIDGLMFETFGEELAFVNNWPADQIWTFVDGDGGEYIISGYHIVNRLGYLLTTVKNPDGDDVIVIDIR